MLLVLEAKIRSELRSGGGKKFYSCNAQLLRYTFLKIILLILQELPLSRNCGQVLEQAQSPRLAFAATTIPFLSSRAGQIILIQKTLERLFFFKRSSSLRWFISRLSKNLALQFEGSFSYLRRRHFNSLRASIQRNTQQATEPGCFSDKRENLVSVAASSLF